MLKPTHKANTIYRVRLKCLSSKLGGGTERDNLFDDDHPRPVALLRLLRLGLVAGHGLVAGLGLIALPLVAIVVVIVTITIVVVMAIVVVIVAAEADVVSSILAMMVVVIVTVKDV